MKRAAATLAGLAALGCAAALEEGYREVFGRRPSRIMTRILKPHPHVRPAEERRAEAAARLRERPCERLTLRSERGTPLVGFYYPCGDRPSGKLVFLVHGYRSDHADAAGQFYDYYTSRGFDLFCPDNAACGESGGHHIGFGVYEGEDCLLWLDELRRRFGADTRIVLHGFSMGGATVLRLSDRVPEAVRGIVDDCGTMDMRLLLPRRLGPLYHPVRLLLPLIGGYTLADTDVRPHLAAARVPILFIHGEEDRVAPFCHGATLYELCPTEKARLFVPQARHLESVYYAPEAYFAALDAFLDGLF